MNLTNKLRQLFGGSKGSKNKSRKSRHQRRSKSKKNCKKCKSGGGVLGLGNGAVLKQALVPLGLLALQRLSSKHSSRKYRRRRYICFSSCYPLYFLVYFWNSSVCFKCMVHICLRFTNVNVRTRTCCCT